MSPTCDLTFLHGRQRGLRGRRGYRVLLPMLGPHVWGRRDFYSLEISNFLLLVFFFLDPLNAVKAINLRDFYNHRNLIEISFY